LEKKKFDIMPRKRGGWLRDIKAANAAAGSTLGNCCEQAVPCCLQKAPANGTRLAVHLRAWKGKTKEKCGEGKIKIRN
jgi:hypothetical protein